MSATRGNTGRFLASGSVAPADRRISVERSPRMGLGGESAPASASYHQPHGASSSARRLPNYGSGRRVNFEHQSSIGSARRSNEASYTGSYAGSSSRNIGGGGGGGGGGLLNANLAAEQQQQQSATHSAVSMNSIFNEARREIRRGNARDSAIRAAEYKAATPTAESDQLLPPTPQQGKADLEAGSPAAAGAGAAAAEGDQVPEVTELSFATDVVAMKDMLRESPVLALMLTCIPLGILAHFTHIGGVSAIFVFNFVAIIPLAWLLGNATEELALRSNQTVGGLLNATFGNAVELIVSIVALRKGMIKLVQTSLLGSILSNCLLVLGMAFLLGGLKNKVQMYNQKGAHMLSSLLLLASIALVLPAAFVNSFTPHPTMAHLLRISRVTAALMFCIYMLYLFFQLFTHAEMFSDENSGSPSPSPAAAPAPTAALVGGASNGKSPKVSSSAKSPKSPFSKKSSASNSASATMPADVTNAGYQSSSRADAAASSDIEEEVVEVEAVSDHMNELSDLSAPLPPHPAASSSRKGSSKSVIPASIAEDEEVRISPLHRDEETDTEEDDAGEFEEEEYEGEDEPQLTFTASLVLLVVVTLFVAICSEFLVDSIDAITAAWGMNESFVGIILIPIVGNAAEHATAVTVAMKNKMDLAIGVAIGSSTQIALFLIPFVVLLGWAIDQPMSLNFSGFETICLTMAVLMVNFLVKNGESNWLQGVMLIAVYGIIATAFWYVPESSSDPRYQNHPSEGWMPTDVQEGPQH